jgi:hypothetical protein
MEGSVYMGVYSDSGPGDPKRGMEANVGKRSGLRRFGKVIISGLRNLLSKL